MNVSFVMTSYNYAQFISQAIESIIDQTVANWELIIVDDGSADNSVEIIKSYCEKDNRIRLFTHDCGGNKGLKKTLLRGLEEARYEWVAFLESDDYLEPNYLEEKFAVINRLSDVKFIYNGINLIGSENASKLKYLEQVDDLWKNCEEPRDVFGHFGLRNIVPTFSAVMCNRQALLNCNFDTPCEPILDYWLWWQMAEKVKFVFLNKKLTNWRLHKKSYFFQESFSFDYNLKRSAFISSIMRVLNRKVVLRGQNKLCKNRYIALIFYTVAYFKKLGVRAFEAIMCDRLN